MGNPDIAKAWDGSDALMHRVLWASRMAERCERGGAGSDSGGAATGATVLGLAAFFLATFLVVGAALAFTFLRAGLAAFFATVFALLDDFAGRAFLFTAFFFATVRFDFPITRFFA